MREVVGRIVLEIVVCAGRYQNSFTAGLRHEIPVPDVRRDSGGETVSCKPQISVVGIDILDAVQPLLLVLGSLDEILDRVVHDRVPSLTRTLRDGQPRARRAGVAA